MDYKYIEQLLERYWQCETSLEEENILRAFFSQTDVPAGLSQYRPLFAYEQQAANDGVLGDDFDSKVLALTEKAVAERPSRMVTLKQRLMPLFKAAAIVAIIVTLGNAAQFSIGNDNADEDINYSSYKDTYNDPSVAYDKVENALELISEGITQSQITDTARLSRTDATDSIR